MPIQFRIKELAESRGLSLLQLATMSNIAYSTIHRIASNQSTRIDLATLEALAKALGVDFRELFADENTTS